MKLNTLINKKSAMLLPSIMNIGLCFMGVTASIAQIQNNTVLHISDNSSVFVDSNSFAFDSSSGQSSTTRTNTTYGKLIFSSGSMATGASTNHYLDGYASIQTTSSFLLPVGQSGVYAPISVTPSNLNPVDVAYYKSNPNTIGNTLDSSVPTLSSLEFWNIQGNNNAMLTLTWSSSSNLSNIASSTIELILAGYDGTKWVRIPSSVNAISILGGSSTLTSGSLSTLTSVNLNNYKYFSIGADATLSTSPFNLSNNNIYIKDKELRLTSNIEMTYVEVFDLTGKRVFESKINHLKEYNTPFYIPKSIYIVKVKLSNDKTIIKKLINPE